MLSLFSVLISFHNVCEENPLKRRDPLYRITEINCETIFFVNLLCDMVGESISHYITDYGKGTSTMFEFSWLRFVFLAFGIFLID